MAAARRQFAERGFYGASIASIAAELDLTKQALIHHFGTKERLYGEVLARLADQLARMVGPPKVSARDAGKQLESVLARLVENTIAYPEDTQLMMRELLDNKARAKHAHAWHMKPFLDTLTSMLRQASIKRMSEADALARVYALLGAANFYAVSQPTLRHMYGKQGYDALREAFPREVRRMVRSALEG